MLRILDIGYLGFARGGLRRDIWLFWGRGKLIIRSMLRLFMRWRLSVLRAMYYPFFEDVDLVRRLWMLRWRKGRIGTGGLIEWGGKTLSGIYLC